MALTSVFPAQGFQNFIDESLVQLTATNGTPGATQFRSSVVNRAPITDISQNLKVSMGIERVMIQQLIQLQNEFGPNGEPIWSALNDDRGMMRFIGAGWNNLVNTLGIYPNTPTAGDYLEITFYGTGLNLLQGGASAAMVLVANVDGGADTANLYPSSQSGVITSRNYASNTVYPIASGLALGLHTIKLRATSIPSANFGPYGFEVINESTTIKTNPGSAFVAGKRLFLSAQDSQSPTSGFTNTFGSAGTKGGRVLQYLALDGTVKKDIQYVDATAQFLTSADHTNEEMVRQYSIREFGAGRTDDFNLATASGNYAFTLDDGTTTLVGSAVVISNLVSGNPVGMSFNVAGFATLTFVGTGVDFLLYDNFAGGNDTYTFQVDGGTAQSWGYTAGSIAVRTMKVVSGLPYGTHTVKINRVSAATFSPAIVAYKVYQPKKPSIPAGAIELCDYNVMATYSVGGVGVPATGALRKMNTREWSYIGSFSTPASDIGYCGGWDIDGATSGNQVKYTFFGTGFEFRFTTVSGFSINSTLSVDGNSNLSGFTTSAVVGGVTGLTWTPSTGTISGAPSASQYQNLIQVSGLTLGLHTLTVTSNVSVRQFWDAIDIITPIHSAKSNAVADLQNTLPVGSQGISDNRLNSPIQSALTSKKAWAQAQTVTAAASTTSTFFVPVADASVTIKTSSTSLQISYSASIYVSAASIATFLQVYVDGVPVGLYKACQLTSASAQTVVSDTLIVPVSAGVHKVDLYWKTNTGTSNSDNRSIVVREI